MDPKKVLKLKYKAAEEIDKRGVKSLGNVLHWRFQHIGEGAEDDAGEGV
jgi:hypothetical protein